MSDKQATVQLRDCLSSVRFCNTSLCDVTAGECSCWGELSDVWPSRQHYMQESTLISVVCVFSCCILSSMMPAEAWDPADLM
ncbi:unnamed protein product [Sphagnum troendelagicum]